MPTTLRLFDVKALLLWALVTAFMFATLDLLIVHINIEPPEAISQMLISVTTFFVFSLIYCAVVALLLGLPLVAITRSRMQTGLSVAIAQGATLGLASAAVGLFLFSFNGPVSTILITLLLGATCGACAGVIGGRATAMTA
jgi:hypothetical protein